MIKGSILFVLSSLLVMGCTKTPQTQESQYAPAPLIGKSFAILKNEVLAPADSHRDNAQISIQKSALEKEFLFQVQMIPQALAPQFHGMESRIVSFRKQNGKVYLIETSKGHTFAPNLPQTLLLAEFPIVLEDDNQITIDFNKGMSQLFVGSDWKTRDMGMTMPDGNLVSVKTAFSYIEDSTFTANNLMIRQVAQLEVPEEGSQIDETVEVQYYVTPYIENKDFQPTVAPRTLDRAGFFEASPLVNGESGQINYASKFDIKKPIVYAISSNTPADFKQAVRDGILYWNRALGQNLITVIDAPQGVSAPNVEYNIVQWVDWESAGFAYADAQMDPRTGEILHQQIYFTSAWASYGKMQASELAKLVGAESPSKTSNFRVGLAGFSPQQLCDMDLNQAAADQLGVILAQGLTPEQQLKAAQDLLREVVAHEVGHTMGLRHNFAGSLAANYPLANRENLFKQYLQTGSAPAGIVTSSSVMDYQFPLESMLNGDQIGKGLPVADYDLKAIRALYLGGELKPEEMPLFCTDSHAMSGIPDCRPYDAGNSPIEWAQYQTDAAIRNLPLTLLFTFQNAKAPMYGEPSEPIEEVAPNAQYVAETTLAWQKGLLGLLPANGQLLSNARSFAFVNSTNQDEVRTRLENYLLTEFKRLGGLNHILAQTDLGFADREDARFEALLADPANLKGTNPNGKPFAFSTEEIATMKQTVKLFYQTLQKEMIRKETTLLAGAKDPKPAGDAVETSTSTKLKRGELADMFATYLEGRASELLFGTTKSPLIIKKVSGGDSWIVGDSQPTVPVASPTVVTYSLPQFEYEFEVRKTAASFLKADRSEDLAWGFSERTALENRYRDYLTTSFAPLGSMTADANTEVKKYSGAPQALIGWLFDVLTIKAAL